MSIRTVSFALVVLLGSLLTGCLPGRRVEIAAGEYAPVRGAGASGPASTIEAVRVDRDDQTAWFMLNDGSQVILSFTPLPRAEWPAGCPTNVSSTHMEVLEIETEDLTIASTTFHRPVLVRNCPPDPVEIVLRSSGEIGGGGNACSGAGECITFETASGATSLPRSMKGYELYSWYLEEEDAWYYTLITGTNRVKSYAELSTSESVITEHDWVKITVRGTNALKSVLDLLPERETVTWNDARRLEGALAVEGAFPGRAVVREIERHCQRRTIRLQVVDCRVGSSRPNRPTALTPSPAPIAEKDLLTYINDDYRLAFIYPSDWGLGEIPAGQEVPGGESATTIHLTKGTLRLTIQFKRAEEATVLGPSGRPAGEIEERGTVMVFGREIPKQVLVFEGKDKSVFLGDRFDDLELYAQLDDGVGAQIAYEAIEIPESVQSAMDAILSSLTRTG